MNSSLTRVVIEYNHSRKLAMFPSNIGETEMLKISFSLFGIEKEIDTFELLIESLNCKVENSNSLITNEILILQPKNYRSETPKRSSRIIKEQMISKITERISEQKKEEDGEEAEEHG